MRALVTGGAGFNTIQDAVRDLLDAFSAQRIPNSMTDDRYYNIKRMQRVNLR